VHIRPKPLAPGASDSIRPRSGHLSGRVAPPTRVGEAGGSRNLTGALPPQALFFGAPPRFFGQDQRNGVDRQRKVKTTANKTASSSNPPPGGAGTPPLQACRAFSRFDLPRGKQTCGTSRTPSPTRA